MDIINKDYLMEKESFKQKINHILVNGKMERK